VPLDTWALDDVLYQPANTSITSPIKSGLGQIQETRSTGFPCKGLVRRGYLPARSPCLLVLARQMILTCGARIPDHSPLQQFSLTAGSFEMS
jgi:hypothetical protein